MPADKHEMAWEIFQQAYQAQMDGRLERAAASPGALLALIRANYEIDVRHLLPSIHVPTLIIQRLSDRITPRCHGRYLASHIAGARYFEQPGDHSLRFAASGDNDELCAEIAGFLAAAAQPGDPDRVLATILRTKRADVVDHGQVGGLVRGHRGRLIRTAADGILATFDAPGQAIRCAAAAPPPNVRQNRTVNH